MQCSRYNFAVASGQLQSQTTPREASLQAERTGLLVSQWHFLPKGTGTFPAACTGASSLWVGCAAVLPLPPLLNRTTHQVSQLHFRHVSKQTSQTWNSIERVRNLYISS
ncbi:unnamed protein product [Symbiodinium natans]|uniref:Uncharacterized protein n=1 Tax=Symbiodinium natans TaxID=878477 RepID=A0A812ILX9_9DINO|nr:unnamed protein product [Symbiodinium natans]